LSERDLHAGGERPRIADRVVSTEALYCIYTPSELL